MPESGDGARLPECFWPVAACCLLACAPPPRALAPPIQTEFVDGIILVDVTLSGGHGWWLLDSGYECSVLDSTAARAASIATTAPEKTRAPGGAINQARATGIALGVSGEEYRPDSVAVVPIAQLSPVVGRVITGILGHDFFERHVVTIDYAARTVRLARPEGWVPPAGATVLPVWIEASEPFVPGTLWVAGRTVPAKLKLDTGSLSGLGLNGSFVAQNRLIPNGWPRRPVGGIAVGGTTRNFVGRIDSMAFGGVIVPAPVAGWSEDLTRVGDAGTVGAPMLSRFRVTFDYARRRLLLEPTAEASQRETWEAAGMFVGRIPDGPVIVAQVMPDTPADSAGIAAGDVLRSVDGREATALGLDALRTHFRQPGRTDTLVVSRDGKERTLRLKQAALP
jgi:hypothetical protein